MNARKLLITLFVIVCALALGSVVNAKGEANLITLHNQEVHNGILMVDAVTAAQKGWLVIYDRASFDKDGIVGYVAVNQGLNQNLRVTLNTKQIKDLPTLWARLHVDIAPLDKFEWGYMGRPYNDPPVVQDGQAVVVTFGLLGDSTPLTIAPAIAVKGQNVLVHNPIIIDSVTTPVDAWVVVYKNQTMTPGSIVGYAPVYQGTNTEVKVALHNVVAKDNPTLWAVLQADNGAHTLFEWGTYDRTMADAPVIYNGQPLMVPFATTGP